MRVAVVILNWNTKSYLKDFLPAMLESLGRDDALIVADSGSEDGSLQMLEAEFPQVRTLPLNGNFGYTGGYNRALGQLDAEYFVLVNSDILVDKNWLEPLVAFMESRPECGICGPKLLGLTKEGNGYKKSGFFEYAGAAGGFLDRFGFPFCRGRVLGRVCADRGQYDSPAEVFWCSGACLMIRGSLWKALGGLDDRFFAHMEEIDLCWRARLGGHKVCVVPQSRVWHLGGGTLQASSPWKLELNYRNNLLMLGKNLLPTYLSQGASPRAAALRAKAKLLARMLLDYATLLIYLLEGKFRYAGAVIRAHKGFRMLKKQAFDSVMAKVPTQGLLPVNIIPNALLRGEGIFDYLDKKLFGL